MPLGAILGAVLPTILGSGAAAAGGAAAGAAGSAAAAAGPTLMQTALAKAGGATLGALGQAGVDYAFSGAEMDRLQRRGATLPEILGSGQVSSGTSSGQTLGNGWSQASEMAINQMFQREMQANELASQERRTAMQVEGQLQATEMTTEASIYNTNQQFALGAMVNDREWQKVMNAWAVNNPEYNIALAEMTAGVENTQIMYIMRRNGLSMADPPPDQETFNRRMSNAFAEIAAMNGVTSITREGIRQWLATLGDATPVLGAGSSDGAMLPVVPPTPSMPLPGQR